jgi:hydrogenase maturation protease
MPTTARRAASWPGSASVRRGERVDRSKILVIGCGNILRGDDAAGPVCVRRMWDRGLPDGVQCADGGTGGMDVAFQMRGVAEVILVDACSSGSEPGTLFGVPGHEVENLPPLSGINPHAFRWDHAIAFGRWLLKDDYPARVTAYLIEGESFEAGAGISPAVDRAIDRLVAHLLGGLWMHRGFELQGTAAGDREALLEAIAAYRRAIQEGITAESDPGNFGQIQNNLGLAYLSIPAREAGDQLRYAVAVQAFRHALGVCDRDGDPDMWSSVTMNLANALQYLPSSHPEENLMQAIDAYEEVLQVRTEDRDPVAHARVLLNQANALAHLGILGPAVEKLASAREAFTRNGRDEEAATAQELVDQIRERVDATQAAAAIPSPS